MNSQNKISKGSVGIESFQGRLRLRLPRQVYGGKQKYLTLGLDDTKENRKIAEAKAKQIESDIVYERFDATLAKYRPQNHLSLVEPAKDSLKQLKLNELWDMYVEYKSKSVAVSTLKNTYKTVSSHIQKLPTQSINDALTIRNYLVNNLKPETAKKYLTNISACCDWAVEYSYIPNNPFLGMAQKIKAKPKDIDEIKPFTKEERDAIIQAFENHHYYKHYASYVKFLFFTGCRTGEAIGLKWKHISKDCTKIFFQESFVRGVRKETKTGKTRLFPCNASLQNLLKSIKPENCDPESLVFSSPEGKEIDDHNFLNRAWKGYKNRHGSQVDGIVTQLVKQGVVSEYRCQYNTRHTFITMAIEAGVTPVQVAKWVGNTPEIIMKHYAGTTRQIQVPEF
ncbi:MULTISPECIES: tyrosine-type recombinase/integrase [Aerosakkonema]|uniref:tyrosine-type recombinase/integrase n=1 Tax=Aerosakkonema TaxID=1246629 RepID=UPI0035B8684B